MKITNIDVDRFGVWRDFHIDGLGDGVSLLCGPNEAGKTTLLEFIRSMLYGIAGPRSRYLAAGDGDAASPRAAGGRLGALTPTGPLSIARHAVLTPEGLDEKVAITAADGTRQGAHLLETILSGIDEPTFGNIFAVGLTELQNLRTLDDTDAARVLYRLAAGLDQISLVEVTDGLRGSRDSVISPDGGSGRLIQLVARRDVLRSEIGQLDKQQRQYRQLATKRDALEAEFARVNNERGSIEREVQAIEAALGARDAWLRRAKLDEQLRELGDVLPVPEDTLGRLDQIGHRLEHTREATQDLRARREQLREELDALPVRESLWRLSTRVDALAAQRSWMIDLDQRVQSLDHQTRELAEQLAEHYRQLGLGDIEHDHEPQRLHEPTAVGQFPRRVMGELRSAAGAMRESRRQREEIEAARRDAHREAAALDTELRESLAARGKSNLGQALSETSDLLSRLRRRQDTVARLEETTELRTRLGQQIESLMMRTVLPGGLLIGLVIVFCFGAMLALAGTLAFGPFIGAVGWVLAVLGLAACGVSVVAKVSLERVAANRLEESRKQATLLDQQIEQLTQQRDQLDRELPPTGESLDTRVRAMEDELRALEQLVPLETRKNAAFSQAEAARVRVESHGRETQDASRRWAEAAEAAGLPRGFTPAQFTQLRRQRGRLEELRRRLLLRREERDAQRAQLDAVTRRIEEVASEAQVDFRMASPLEILDQLIALCEEQRKLMDRRDELHRAAGRLRSELNKTRRTVSRLKFQRRSLLLECGATDESRLREAAQRHASVRGLQRERAELTRAIDAAIASAGDPDRAEKLITTHDRAQLETMLIELIDRHAALEKSATEKAEQRGALREQIRALSEDRRAAERRLELASIEAQITRAAHGWRVAATVAEILDEVRTTYERQRQPATLREASEYFRQLTQDRYQRVWTPLDQDILRIDDAGQRILGVEQLSRGTREQLFLALRMALVTEFERRGTTMPLILDDVLVNFDVARGEAAVETLMAFAQTGRQLLVFTCHEHIMRAFQSAGAAVVELPSHGADGEKRIALRDNDKKSDRGGKSGSGKRSKTEKKKSKQAKAPLVVDMDAADTEIPDASAEEFTQPDDSESYDSSDSLFDVFDQAEESLDFEDEDDDDEYDKEDEEYHDVDAEEEEENDDMDEGDDDDQWESSEDEYIEWDEPEEDEESTEAA